MEKVGIAKLKDKLSEILKLVRGGKHLIITDHGKPVAKLVPLDTKQPQTREEKIMQLVERGIVSAYCLNPIFEDFEPVDIGAGNIASRMVIEDRDDDH